MVPLRERLAREAAARGKYAPLYRRLAAMDGPRWRVSFGEIEAILGFDLPASARLHRPWWANQNGGGGHSHALAWQAAGWKTGQVDLEAETLVFERPDNVPARAGRAGSRGAFDLDRDFPAVDMGPWPNGFTVSREQIYDDMGRLTGGPEGDSGGDR